MWDSAFVVSTQVVTDALLHRTVLPQGARAFEKVSGAIAVRTALRVRSAEQTLLFLVPEVTASTARQVTAALLVGDHAHAHGDGYLPAEESHRLLRGDVLLVTQAVSDSKNQLDDLPIGKYQRLSDIWEVVPLSRYTAAKTEKPRVCLANPGWFAKSAAGRRFGAVVIDASHPRTLEQLPELVRLAAGCSSLRFVVAPPASDALLSSCGYPGKASVWVWDPQAQIDAQTAVEANDQELHVVGDRFLWVCDSDAEAAAALGELRRRLIAAAKSAAGRPYPGLQQCWSIYNRLRQLVVPLAQLEQAAASTWAGNLRARIDELQAVQGHGNVAWDTTWPGLVEATTLAYQTLLKRDETAKFWAVASNVEAFIASKTPHLRIVVGSEPEAELLATRLEQLVDGFAEAVAHGRVELVTAGQEAKLVAEGHRAPTVLLGPRTNGHRYLDVFPSTRVDEFLYPHEVNVECASQARLYGPWTQALTDERRVQLLEPLGLRAPKSAKANGVTSRPSVTLRRPDGHPVKLATGAALSSELDIDSLMEGLDHDSTTPAPPLRYFGGTATAGDVVEVTFTQGGQQHFYSNQNVDVFFSASGVVQRHPAPALKPGWQVISFVDGRYDGLFQRLTEVVNSRLRPDERVALDLWDKVKEAIAARYESKRALHAALLCKGLQSGYETFTTWFREGDEEVIAPQQFDEFKVLASESDTYKSQVLLEATFKAIQRERGRNRAAGRTLRRFLRAVVSGDGYDAALDSARKLDTALGDVLAAVEVLEVQSVHVNQRSHDG